jgi:hypothetical protein
MPTRMSRQPRENHIAAAGQPAACEKESTVRNYTSCWRWAVVFGALVALTGCTYIAVQRLPLDEQAAFHTYSKVMTGVQVHTYLAKTTPTEREAYLQKIGIRLYRK